MKKVAVSCDHAGFPLKDVVIGAVRECGFEPLDLGTDSTTSVDYPDFVAKAGRAVQSGEAWRAVVICGSGVGASIAANKMRGIYAGLCHDHYSAHQGVEHDDMNVLCLGARIIGPAVVEELVQAFLNAEFTAEERHSRRTGKIRAIEQQELGR
ncbi:MAG TPA: ribose 5-phosphate isomerase B [Anaerolineaceae bacterium]|nr:ribose 5-phosphate isomerase B [Anaerolineaceae bacterium]